MSYWETLHHHTDIEQYWTNHPRVRARINRRISGDPSIGPMDWFVETVRERLPFQNALSVGCGVGNLERDVVRRGITKRITGIDSAENPLQQARCTTAAEGFADQITYQRADARDYISRQENLDAIFFHASMHHFDRVHELMTACRRALRPDGILYLDEYVGPSRNEWTLGSMMNANRIYYSLPRAVRRVGIIRRPINREDPTEAAATGTIIPAVESSFRVLERKDYGGNLLALLYPNLNLHGAPATALNSAVDYLLELEEVSLKTNAKSFYTVIIATPRTLQ